VTPKTIAIRITTARPMALNAIACLGADNLRA
jgi:hypothetical protein